MNNININKIWFTNSESITFSLATIAHFYFLIIFFKIKFLILFFYFVFLFSLYKLSFTLIISMKFLQSFNSFIVSALSFANLIISFRRTEVYKINLSNFEETLKFKISGVILIILLILSIFANDLFSLVFWIYKWNK